MDILSELYELRASYTYVIEEGQGIDNTHQFEELLIDEYCDMGMCYWLDYSPRITMIQKDVIVHALEIDKIANSGTDYWYPVPGITYHTVASVVEHCLQPRLDNINRTIARLESEIQNQY